MIFTSNGQRFIQLNLFSSFHLSFFTLYITNQQLCDTNTRYTTFVAVIMIYLPMLASNYTTTELFFKLSEQQKNDGL